VSADLPEISALLHEGFPQRSLSYWKAASANLQARAEVQGYPKFGFAMDVDGSTQGVILLLTSDLGNGPRSNLSSWYVRPAFRQFATFLLQRSLATKVGVFLNLSPAIDVLPIMTAFGFRPYTAGVILMDARAALRKANVRVAPFKADKLKSLTCAEMTTIVRHLNYGCAGLELQDEVGTTIVLYRVKMLKGIIPCAQFLFGDPARLLAAAGPVMRSLLPFGIPTALIDSDGTEVSSVGRFVRGRSLRYVRGSIVPPIGDLLETELAVFGP
jgi:hypothetical protein